MTSTGKILMVAALALILAGAADARTGSKIVGNGQAVPGSLVLYFAQGTAASPKSLSAKVSTTPSQKVTLKWAVSCSKGAPTGAVGAAAYDSSTTQKSGQATVTAPATAPLPLPIAHAKSCSVSLYAFLTKKAKATLQIMQG